MLDFGIKFMLASKRNWAVKLFYILEEIYKKDAIYLNVQRNSLVMPSGTQVLFLGKSLVTDSISLRVIGVFIYFN